MKHLIVLLVLGVAYAKHEQYEGWKSYFVEPKTLEQQKDLGKLADQLGLDFLNHPVVNRESLVLVQPEQLSDFISAVENLGVTYKVHSENVAETLHYDDAQSRARDMARGARRPFENYLNIAGYDSYLEDIAARYPETTTLVNGGLSFEGRPVYYLKISTTNFEDTSKPIIFIDAGIHAREWIAPPTVAWAIHKLVEDVTEPDLLENFDWILLPVVNPDGYEYSHTTSRFWRKTRSIDGTVISRTCPGVDGNRNFEFEWNTVGTSNFHCSEIYAGNHAFSEPESRVVSAILHEYVGRIAMYITMHSFGSMVLYPWSHDSTLSNNALALHLVGVTMAEAIRPLQLPHFPNYVVGNLGLVLQYEAAGGSIDYAHDIGVPLTFAFELPGLSTGAQGFNLPPQYIEQICRETWAGFVAGARQAGAIFEPNPFP